MPLLPRREDPDDRRGHRRGPADGDRPGAGGMESGWQASRTSPAPSRRPSPIREVGPRDGFQNEPEVISTADKIRLIDMLGRDRAQAPRSDLVRARGRDPAARRRRRRCCAAIELPDEVAGHCADPNERGFDNALALPRALQRDQLLPERFGVAQPRERQPQRRGVAERAAARDRPRRARRGCAPRASSASASVAPTRGTCRAAAVFAIARAMVDAGAAEIALRRHDRDGEPPSGARVLRRRARGARRRGRADRALPQHPRAGSRERLRGAGGRDATSFESSFGELGGCPVPAGATGNIATEDLVGMLHEMGMQTGIDLPSLLAASRAAREVLGRPLGSPHADRRPGRLARGCMSSSPVLIANRGEIAVRIARTTAQPRPAERRR